MGEFLTMDSVLMCPHGGTVTAVTTNTAVQAMGGYVVRSSDNFMVAGCVFTLPDGTPYPCVTVQWITSSLATSVMNDNVLTTDSQGLCLAADQTPQGTVLVVDTQLPVSGT